MNSDNFTKTQNLHDSNSRILELIQKGNSFSVVRLGNSVSSLTVSYLKKNKFNNGDLLHARTHDGIYTETLNQIEKYCELYAKSIENCDLFACFTRLCTFQQNFFINRFNIPIEKIIFNRSLEPFYLLQEKKNVLKDQLWTHSLKNKTVLVISPFVNDFKGREHSVHFYNSNNEKVFLWDKNQKFVYYESINSLGDETPHKNWIRSFEFMKNDIKKIDFDIAILSCGGYGLPLCDWIKNELKKSSIYIGGALQLLFGVYGERWKKNDVITRLIDEKDNNWIRPSYRFEDYKNIENGCYW